MLRQKNECSTRMLSLRISWAPPLEDALNQRLASLSQQFTLVCQTLKVPYLEVFTALQHMQVWKEEVAANDGAHPRVAGYALLAQLVQEWSCWKSWLV